MLESVRACQDSISTFFPESMGTKGVKQYHGNLSIYINAFFKYSNEKLKLTPQAIKWYEKQKSIFMCYS